MILSMLANGASDLHHGESSPHIDTNVEGIKLLKKAQRRFDAVSSADSSSRTALQQMYNIDIIIYFKCN
jgi:hypothetical protein